MKTLCCTLVSRPGILLSVGDASGAIAMPHIAIGAMELDSEGALPDRQRSEL